MDELICSQSRLLDICRKEGINSRGSYNCAMLIPPLLWSWSAHDVLEIGIYDGFTTLAIGLQLEMMGGGNLWTCDIASKRVVHAEELIHKYAPSVQVTAIPGDSRHVAWSEKAQFDFAYIDGNHTFRSVRADLAQVLPAMRERAAVLLQAYTYTISHASGVVNAVNGIIPKDPSWSFVPIPAPIGAPAALMARTAKDGLPIVSKESITKDKLPDV